MDFLLPDLGEGVQEGELIAWLVKEGEHVKRDQPLVEVMTDKATMEVPSSFEGVISGFKAKEGDMVKVGQVMANVDSTKSTGKEDLTEERHSTVFEEKEKLAPKSETVNKAQESAHFSPKVDADGALHVGIIPASPRVRALAREKGIDLARVEASGPQVGERRRVVEEDLQKLSGQPSAESSVAGKDLGAGALQAGQASFVSKPLKVNDSVIIAGEEEERVPLRGLRRVIADGMSKSKFTIPHYSYVDEFECSSLIDMRQQAKEMAAQYGVKFSYLPFIVKALVAALKEFPECNSTLQKNDDGKSDIVLKKYFHIGIAVATEGGLLVPVIRHADQKSLLEIAKEINELSQKTHAGKATAKELKGSTFTITSLGNIGGLFATPIINYPEVGILGVYKIRKQPVVKNDRVEVGNVMALSLSLDHRVVDGAIGARFCNSIIDRLSKPAKLLMELK